MPAQTYLFGCLSDNFGVLLHDPETGATASIDAPEAGPVEAALKKTGTQSDWLDKMQTRQELYDLLDYDPDADSWLKR